MMLQDSQWGNCDLTIRTEVSEQDTGDPPRAEDNVAGMLQHAPILLYGFIQILLSEEMETDSAIDMTTATVSDDQIDVEIVAFSRGFQ